MPTGLIQVDGWLFLNIVRYCLHWFFQHCANTAFLGWNTSQADIRVEDRCHDFLHVSLTDAKATTQISPRGLCPGTKTSGRYIGRPFSFVLAATGQACQRMQLIFDDFWVLRWAIQQFDVGAAECLRPSTVHHTLGILSAFVMIT